MHRCAGYAVLPARYPGLVLQPVLAQTFGPPLPGFGEGLAEGVSALWLYHQLGWEGPAILCGGDADTARLSSKETDATPALIQVLHSPLIPGFAWCIKKIAPSDFAAKYRPTELFRREYSV